MLEDTNNEKQKSDVESIYDVAGKFEWFPGSNGLNVGYYVGTNLVLMNVVLEFKYQHDLTRFDSALSDGIQMGQKWFSYNLKIGYRFRKKKQSLRGMRLLSDCCLYGCLD